MKNLLNQFKEEVGKLLISFGEKLTGEINKTNDKVDALEKRVQALESKEVAAPEQKVKVEKNAKVVKVSNIGPNQKDTMKLFQKVTTMIKGYKSEVKNTLTVKEGVAFATNMDGDKYVYIEIKGLDLDQGVYNIAGEKPFMVKSIDGFKRQKFDLDLVLTGVTLDDFKAAYEAIPFSGKGTELMISSIRFKAINGVLDIVATDSYRLYRLQRKTNAADFDLSISTEVFRIIKDDIKYANNDNFKVYASGDNIKIEYANREVHAKAFQNKVAYERILEIGKDFTVKADEFEVKEALTAHKALNVTNKSMQAFIKFENGKATLLDKDEQAISSMDIEMMSKDIKVNMKRAFLEDVYKVGFNKVSFDKSPNSAYIFHKDNVKIAVMPCVWKENL